MPLPTPRGDESEQDFVSRFMGNEQATSDFPDETQRAAVAYRTYRDEDEELELPSVSILEEGEAKGHDLFVDRVSLERALSIMKGARNGVKVKMNHGSGLDAVVGFARNPRIDGNRLIADLRLLRNSPHYGLIKEMASEAPDQFGVSLAFVNESETIDGKDYIRPQSIASADLVSSPAATNGLFEEMLAFMEKIKKFDCGTGAGGFKPGNDCAKGGGGGAGKSSSGRKPSKKEEDDADNDENIGGVPKPRTAKAEKIFKDKLYKSIENAEKRYKSGLRDIASDEDMKPDLDDFKKLKKWIKSGDYEAADRHIGNMSEEASDVISQRTRNALEKERYGFSNPEFLNILANEMQKEFRCWEGYEPVPGKKPYSEGSCMKAETQTKNSGKTIKMGYVSGGETIPSDDEDLTPKEKNMGNDYGKDIEDIKVRLSALEQAVSPKDEEKENKEEEVTEAEKFPLPEEKKKEDEKVDMSAVVKKVLTEFGIKPIPASPVIQEAPKKDEPKNFEALVASHPEYAKSKLTAMKAVMLSNPNEYRDALARGISKI